MEICGIQNVCTVIMYFLFSFLMRQSVLSVLFKLMVYQSGLPILAQASMLLAQLLLLLSLLFL